MELVAVDPAQRHRYAIEKEKPVPAFYMPETDPGRHHLAYGTVAALEGHHRVVKAGPLRRPRLDRVEPEAQPHGDLVTRHHFLLAGDALVPVEQLDLDHRAFSGVPAIGHGHGNDDLAGARRDVVR